jgi:hypothetical protein
MLRERHHVHVAFDDDHGAASRIAFRARKSP